MSVLRFALAQHDFPVGDVAGNGVRVRQMLGHGEGADVQLVVFPELTLSGYPPEDLLLRPSFLRACEDELELLAPATSDVAALVGWPQQVGDEVFNAASWFAGGKLVRTAHKQVLPNYAVFDEKRYFQCGTETSVHDFAGVRIAVLVCEDIWDDGPVAGAAAAGAELILVINASPWDTGKRARREATLARHARSSGCAIAYVNLVGGQDDLLFDGSSLLVNPDGSIVARAPAFAEALLVCSYDSATRTLQAERWPQQVDDDEAVLYAALVRGIRDYVTKNGFHNVLLGLSGGIDSALTLALAVDALGARHVSVVMLPSRFTSQVSLDGAQAEIRKLGVADATLSIEPGFAALLETLRPAFGEGATNLAEENLQARIRGVLLMALSNQRRALLLTTGNKSELAVGYCTLYGDMCGAYAPLKDVYKTRVYALAKWRNQQKDGEVIPQMVIDRPPSAELAADQTDQDSLPPYPELDAILERFIEGEQAQADIVAAGFDAATVRRIARLVLANEFKRRQGAPGPKVTRRAFGRERRYPISSGWR